MELETPSPFYCNDLGLWFAVMRTVLTASDITKGVSNIYGTRQPENNPRYRIYYSDTLTNVKIYRNRRAGDGRFQNRTWSG